MQDYYSLLNLSRKETPAGISAAHRDFLRNAEHAVGPLWPAARIMACERAFSVLSDKRSRAAYDCALALKAKKRPEPVLEAMRPESLLSRPQSVHPSYEGLWQRFARNFTGVGIPKSEHCEPVTVEVPVTTDDVEMRRIVRVGIPILTVCPACNGTGRVVLFECSACHGTGIIGQTEVVEHVLGQKRTVERSLDLFGIGNCFLRLEIRVLSA